MTERLLGLAPTEARAARLIAGALLLILFRGSPKPKGGYRSLFAMAVWSNLVMSLLLTFFMGETLEPAVFPLVSMGLAFFLVGSTVAGDFAIAILEHQDAEVLSHRPISSRALLAGRLFQVLVVLGIVTGAFFVAPAFGGWPLLGWSPLYPPLFLFMGALETVFLTAAVIGLYLVLLRWIHVERVKAVAGWLNAVLTVGMVLSYQLQSAWAVVGELAEDARLSWVSWLVPPAWFSAPVEMLARGFDGRLAAQGVLAAAATVGLSAAVLGVLGRSYAEKLGAGLVERRLEAKGEGRRLVRLGRVLLCARRGAERAGFDLVSYHRKTIRPWFSSSIFLAMILLSAWQGVIADPFAEGEGFLAIFWEGLVSIVFVTGILAARYSPSFRAAWVLRVAPSGSPCDLWEGAKKALLWMYAPLFLVLFAVLALLWPAAHAAWFAAGSFLIGALLLHLASLGVRELPASVDPMTQATGGWILGCMLLGQLLGLLFGSIQVGLHKLGALAFGLYWLLMGLLVWAASRLARSVLSMERRWEAES